VFDVYNIKSGEYLKPAERVLLINLMGLKHVPVIHPLWPMIDVTIEGLLEYAEDTSNLNAKQEREGIVFKQLHGGMTFKAISNKYLLGEK
jgi:ATP-dependent RNA circularization protein (DNA/RNA ligase family)